MALIIPPGFVQAVYRMRLDGDTEDMLTTCGHEMDSASGANADDVANDLFIAFANTVFPQVNADYQLIGVDAYVGQDGPDPLVRTSNVPAERAINTGAALPPNSGFLIRKRTDLGGRRGRGRMYIPGVMETDVDNVGVLGATVPPVWQQNLDDWMTALTDAPGARLYPPVVLHRSEGIGEEPLPTPIVRFTIEGKIATQRRRLRP